MWDLIISNAISGTLVLSGAIWYFKKYINGYVDHEFNKRTEVFKAELQIFLKSTQDCALLKRQLRSCHLDMAIAQNLQELL